MARGALNTFWALGGNLIGVSQQETYLADGLVPVVVRVVMAPLKIILLFRAGRSRKISISLVVIDHVLVIHLIFILVPLVVVTSVFVVVALGLVV